ncbi:hypothetical protein GCM10010508_19670 [Streptomyces naganishii JCM 4654]|uniref:Uncharacterized protein n=1 Tax=Streptomyces naganishii JCM 4654 TaxID=1306179 RepID=A0A919CUV0_9ACTN|nr:hypothetical protein GCM10010508_19670 [Streptomyces naganishii JCM 4654]
MSKEMCSTEAYASDACTPRSGAYEPVYGRSVMSGWKKKLRKVPVSTRMSRL